VGFLAEAKSQHIATGRNRTKEIEIQNKLGPKDYQEFLAAMKDPEITSAAISRALKNRKIDCAPNTIGTIRGRMKSDDNK
jgi:hypothetical protein